MLSIVGTTQMEIHVLNRQHVVDTSRVRIGRRLGQIERVKVQPELQTGKWGKKQVNQVVLCAQKFEFGICEAPYLADAQIHGPNGVGAAAGGAPISANLGRRDQCGHFEQRSAPAGERRSWETVENEKILSSKVFALGARVN